MWRSVGKWWWYPAWLVLVMVVAAAPGYLTAQGDDTTSKPTDDFTVSSLDADYTIVTRADGRTDVRIVEKYQVVFNRSYTNRGIVRLIPLRYRNHENTVTDVSVSGSVTGTSPGARESTAPPPYTSAVQDRVYALRIGDPSKYAKANVPQTYVISYTLGDVAMGSFDRTRQEIYLDVNGSGWKQPFDRVTATVHVPAELAPRLDGAAACYQGTEGSTARCGIERNADGATFTASGKGLGPGETMTVAVGFVPGTFPVAYTPLPDWAIWANDGWWVLVLPGIGLLAYGIVRLVRLRYGRVRKPDVVVVEFRAPKQLPAFAAADLMGVPERAAAATLLDLVVRRIARIRTDDTVGVPPVPADPGTRLSARAERRLRRSLTLEVPDLDEDDFQDREALKVVRAYVPRGARSLDDRDTRVGSSAAANRTRYMTQRGWRGRAPGRPWWLNVVYVGMLATAGILVLTGGWRGPQYWWGVGLGVVGVLLLVAGFFAWPAQGRITEAGAEVRDQLLGLREFVTMSEANRIAWLQSATTAPRVRDVGSETILTLYEPLLPYALIFGVERSWATLIGEHEARLADEVTTPLFANLGRLTYGDWVSTVGHAEPYRQWATTETSYGGGGILDSYNDSIGRGWSDFSDAISSMSSSRNDGGGSSGGSSWSSGSGGGSSGGGSSGGGMGGGGGGGW